MNFAQEMELETGDKSDSAELALRVECLERQIRNLETWLAELASDVLDRFGVARLDQECETERLGS